MHCITLHCVALHSMVLDCDALYCVLLPCIVNQSMVPAMCSANMRITLYLALFLKKTRPSSYERAEPHVPS